MGDLGGITTMLPSADAQWVGAELTARFGMPLWSFTLSATDANRWAVRLARLATGKPKILVFGYCYHGSVDETFAIPGPDGKAQSRPGQRRSPGAAGPDDPRRDVERPRLGRARTRPR
jgi:glutamate-1-semialdehyde 2,1-aminomutase